MIVVKVLGVAPKFLIHTATCDCCGTKYEFEHADARPMDTTSIGGLYLTICPTCEREVYSPMHEGRQPGGSKPEGPPLTVDRDWRWP